MFQVGIFESLRVTRLPNRQSEVEREFQFNFNGGFGIADSARKLEAGTEEMGKMFAHSNRLSDGVEPCDCSRKSFLSIVSVCFLLVNFGFSVFTGCFRWAKPNFTY